jgi:hypothetical protein
MTLATGRGYCDHCQAHRPLVRNAPSHLLHAVVTLFLCGLWLPAWLLAAILVEPWRCAQCGEPCRETESGERLLWLLGAAAIAAIFVVLMRFALEAHFRSM